MMTVHSLPTAIQAVYHSLIDHPRWHTFGKQTCGSWRDLLLIESVVRYPRQTLHGYVNYLHYYTPLIVASVLEKALQQGWLVLDHGKYEPGPRYPSYLLERADLIQELLNLWPTAAAQAVAEYGERLCATIPAQACLDHLLYAYGPRPSAHKAATFEERALLVCTALSNYRADAKAWAWHACGISPAQGIILRSIIKQHSPISRCNLLIAVEPYLGICAESAIEALLAQQWITRDDRGLRLTATGWGYWHAGRSALRQRIAQLYGVLNYQETQEFIMGAQTLVNTTKYVFAQHLAIA
ncbi:hypothetical protein [Herpetosiphon geysericola]|uniref:Uncharacterized protein n=1 Tax=Herpetosiphon geysericola TaxID=70996 RepID=A0A0P6XNA9_9CHLR|nr:hypothetical protein [Herpetosiphon geysericola]KPL81293.1 hypothetical protein SE18_21720 [Herpetosiphon geysericola]